MFRPIFHKLYLNNVRQMSTQTFNAEQAASKLHITFKTPGILQQALTHRSYLQGNLPTNDRLQRLGNQVLRLTVCEEGVKSLGNAAHKNDLRDYITKYTDSDYLAQQFDVLDLTDGLRYKAPGQGVPTLIKAKAFESVVGAICHDQGTKAAQEFVTSRLFK
ncbi:ribonuclease III domain-containing protein [Halteromyces radiatus]|uniref:ribonuclease III domain-containing protein n=1 Tax=Halteromyces radiatus TaxID=101107 RepID=UPI00221F32DF|nr:ribonuclease III domain-containing protein [Halteromyces radiatus]KAI8098714.1 ribonuclease III domain-containing protein [Halteromyces radiatus]